MKENIEDLLAEGKTIELHTRGWSMYPLLVDGRDTVRIQDCGNRKLKRADVVLYRRLDENILVLHRIWKVRKDGLYLVGDNQKKIEGPLQREQMKGILVGFTRKGKYYSIHNIWYQCYARLWLFLRPARPWISKRIHKIKVKAM